MPKIVRFYEFGEADVLKLEDQMLVEPGEGEVRLKVEAIGLNRAEVGFRAGRYLELPKTFPSTLGYEASGVIDAIGSGVTGFQIGDRVSTIPAFSMLNYGTYGESAIAPASAVAHYPETLSPTEGTAIWMAYITAYGPLVEYGQVKAGDFVLITAASSSVGYSAIQIAKSAGAVAIVTTRSNAKKQMLLDKGADQVIVTNDEDLVSRILEITNGHGVDLIFDAVAGSLLETLAAAAASGATIFVYGSLDETTATPFPLLVALQKGLKVQGYTLFEITTNLVKLEHAKQYIYKGLESGKLLPILDRKLISI
jgi:NADPH:quinone reductase-like Zn-dependent oxidoreductase